MRLLGHQVRLAPVLVAAALAATACGDSRAADVEPLAVPTGAQTELVKQVSARIHGSGASFPDAFYQEAVDGLDPVAPKLSVTYEAVGSAAGREALGVGLTDFAGTDSLVGDEDRLEPGTFRYVPAVAAPIAVVVHLPGVDDLRLDQATLAAVFQGDIDRWNHPDIVATNADADLPDRHIVVARRADGSGTTKHFTRFLDRSAPNWRLGTGDTVEWPADTQGGQQNAGVAQLVVDTPGAIGYLDFGNASELGLATVAVRNRDGEYVTPSIASTQVALEHVEVADDLTFDPIDAPGRGSYPITAPTYLLVRSRYDDARTGEAVVAFVRWLITDGADTYAAELGFAPLPDGLRGRAIELLSTIEVA